MTQFLQLLVLGMATGGFYTISALGLTVVFRASGIINFATAGTAMIGGYLSWTFADDWGMPHAVSLPLAVLSSALAGVLIYAIAVRPLSSSSTLTKVISTLAVFVVIQQAIQIEYGGVPKLPKAYLPTSSVHIGSVAVGADSLIILAFAVVLTFVLWAVYRFTRFGVATSALAESPRSLAALGWRVERLRTANWAIAGGLAGIAGAGLGPLLQLTPTVFSSLLIPLLASAIIGGLRSFPLTLVGGLFVGAAQSEANRYLTWHSIGQAAPFLVIVIFLIARGKTLPLRSFVQERLPRVGTGRIHPVLAVIAVVVVSSVFYELNDSLVIGATFTVMVAIVLLSQVVVTGYAGQLSLAQLTLGGVGGIIAANAAAAWHTPFLLSLLFGVLVTIPISLLVGLSSLRARGVSLAIATLGFAVAINAVVLGDADWSGGPTGLQVPEQKIFGWSLDTVSTPWNYLVVCLVLFLLIAIVVANVRRGRIGRRMLAVRANERAAAALGINVAGIKLYSFTLAGAIAAVGGVLLTFKDPVPSFSGYDPLGSLTNLVAVVLGGIGYVFGPIFGGMLNADGLPNAIISPYTTNISWWNSVFPLVGGIGLIIQLIANPNGALDAMMHPRGRKRRKQAAKAVQAVQAADEQAQPADQRRSSQAAVSEAAAHAGPAGRTARSLNPLRRADTDAAVRAALASAAQRPRDERPGTLELRDVRVCFGTVVAVDSVSVTVRPGEVVAVIGPNGAGKTTLMDAVTGFVSMTGEVSIDGERIETWRPHRRARRGLVRSFQSLELLEDMTVLDNLRCAGDAQDFASLLLDLVHPNRGELTAATAAAVHLLRLEHTLNRVPTEISYGDRRLVAVARALAAEPSVLMLDEPAAGLSSTERAELASLITLIAREWGIGVMLVEHDVDLVRRVSDRVVALDFGRQICEGTPDEVLAHEEVVRAYLGVDDEDVGSSGGDAVGQASTETADAAPADDEPSSNGTAPRPRPAGATRDGIADFASSEVAG